MWPSALDMLDRKPRASYEERKNQESYESHAQMLLARIPGHQAQLRHCSSADNSPILLHQVPGNANSPEPDQRKQEFDYHSSGSVLPLDDGLGQVVPLDRSLGIPFKTFLLEQQNFLEARIISFSQPCRRATLS